MSCDTANCLRLLKLEELTYQLSQERELKDQRCAAAARPAIYVTHAHTHTHIVHYDRVTALTSLHLYRRALKRAVP